MNLGFSARIDGAQIICDIGSDTALAAPVLCFSLLAAPRVIDGGVLQRCLAGYGEVVLPDIAAGQTHRLVLAYDHPDYSPKNRAWLPLGAYLRVGKTAHPLPAGFDLGVRLAPNPAAAPLPAQTLPLIPPPQNWHASGGALAFIALRPDPAFEGADALARRMGLAPLTAPDGYDARPVIDPALPEEGYRLTVT